LSIIPDESAITKFNSLNEATSFWINEKNNINDGHNKALSIIEDLKKSHTSSPKRKFKEFTQKIEEAKKGKKQ